MVSSLLSFFFVAFLPVLAVAFVLAFAGFLTLDFFGEAPPLSACFYRSIATKWFALRGPALWHVTMQHCFLP